MVQVFIEHLEFYGSMSHNCVTSLIQMWYVIYHTYWFSTCNNNSDTFVPSHFFSTEQIILLNVS